MKKILRLLLGAFILIFCLFGCNGPEPAFQDLNQQDPRQNESAVPDQSPTPSAPEEILQQLPDVAEEETEDENLLQELEENGQYTDKERVALYIHTYGKLPSNFVTKKEAQNSGWNNKENTLDEVLPGKSIGGDFFGNYEGLLPKESGRKYKECDIDYEGGSRNAKRIVFSNDGLIFYTEDHYNSFSQLY